MDGRHTDSERTLRHTLILATNAVECQALAFHVRGQQLHVGVVDRRALAGHLCADEYSGESRLMKHGRHLIGCLWCESAPSRAFKRMPYRLSPHGHCAPVSLASAASCS